MSECKRFKKLISDYLDDELSADLRVNFDNHLEDCPGCADTTSQIETLKDELKKLPQIQTSPDFDTVLRTRIRIESGIGRRRLHEIVWDWSAKIPVYGMAVALMIIAIVAVISQVNKPTRPEAYPNEIWIGGEPVENKTPNLIKESENYIEVIYEIDRIPPQNSLTNRDSIKNVRKDSSNEMNTSRIQRVNHRVY